MKYILLILILVMMFACSSPIDGLWIEENDNGFLNFYKDSVVNRNFGFTWGNDTYGFRITEDSITWTGLDPELNGKTENTFKYNLDGDTLQIQFGPKNRGVFIKTKAANFHEYYLTKGGLKLELPSAENVKRTRTSPDAPLNIRVGFKNDKVALFVDELEMNLSDMDQAIKEIVSRREVVDRDIVNCQLFIDKNVTCDFTFLLLNRLRANNIHFVSFVTKTDEVDPYSQRFKGLILWLPAALSEQGRLTY